MRVFVTGGAGFVGAHVVAAMVDAGHEVSVLIMPGEKVDRLTSRAASIKVHEAPLGDTSTVHAALAEFRPEICVHAAWYAVPGKYLHDEVNIRLVSESAAFANCAFEVGCKRFVGVGSSFEYDFSFGFLREDETPSRPHSLYGVCKNATREILATLAKKHECSFAWTRLFHLYGPTEAHGRLVSDVASRLLHGERVPVSDGFQVRDFMHVADVGRAIACVATSNITGTVNVASGAPVRVRDIVAKLGELTGASDRIGYGEIPRAKGEPPVLCASVERLTGLGFVPTFDLESGLRNTVESWRAAGKGRPA